MSKYKFKVGDIVIGVKNDPEWSTMKIKGNIGTIIEVDNEDYNYHYRVKFREQVDYEYDGSNLLAYTWWTMEDQIKPITSIKLKQLLKD